MTITLKNGAVLVSPVTAARGDPETALSEEELDHKFDLFASGLGVERSAEVKTAIRHIAQSSCAITALEPIFHPVLAL